MVLHKHSVWTACCMKSIKSKHLGCCMVQEFQVFSEHFTCLVQSVHLVNILSNEKNMMPPGIGMFCRLVLRTRTGLKELVTIMIILLVTYCCLFS